MRLFRIAAAICLTMLALPSPAFAAYGYNYGFNWTQAPWSSWVPQNDMSGAANAAAMEQSQSGYEGHYYGWGKAPDIWNMMGAVSLMHIASHGNKGYVFCNYGEGANYHFSVLTSNFDLMPPLHEGKGRIDGSNYTGTLKSCYQVRYRTASPIKVIIYQSCYSGADPDGGLMNLLWASVSPSYAGMHFAGGFQGEIALRDILHPTYWPYEDWSWSYWDSLKRGYYAGWSMNRAANAIRTKYGGDYLGTNTLYYRGNANELL
jgi:hypothetical protein